MSYFTVLNAHGSTVFEVEGRRRLDHVLSVDTTAGVVVRAEQPLRIVGDDFAKYAERFERIHAIYGCEAAPVLFHCYGKKAQNAPGDAHR